MSEIVSGSVRAFDGHFIMVGFGKVGSRGLQFRTVLAQSFREGTFPALYCWWILRRVRVILFRRVLNIVRRVLFECAPSLRHTFSRLPIAPSRRRRFVRLFQGRVVRLIGFCRMSERERVGFSLSFRHTFSGLVGSRGRRFCFPPFPYECFFLVRAFQFSV